MDNFNALTNTSNDGVIVFHGSSILSANLIR